MSTALLFSAIILAVGLVIAASVISHAIHGAFHRSVRVTIGGSDYTCSIAPINISLTTPVPCAVALTSSAAKPEQSP